MQSIEKIYETHEGLQKLLDHMKVPTHWKKRGDEHSEGS